MTERGKGERGWERVTVITECMQYHVYTSIYKRTQVGPVVFSFVARGYCIELEFFFSFFFSCLGNGK